MRRKVFLAVSGLAVVMMTLADRSMGAQSAEAVPQRNSSVVDADGTAHVTRVVPIPGGLSAEAQAMLRNSKPDAPQTLEERRAGTDRWQTGAGEASRGVYPVTIKDGSVGGVPVREVTPMTMAHGDWVLICLHGGGFNSDSGSFTESIPVANLVGARVVSVLYSLAPEHPYPAALNDAVAVYRELLKRYKPRHIVIYGTSAGAVLTAEVAVRLKGLGLPMPAALGIFSGFGDFSEPGDSRAMYSLRGLTGTLPLVSEQAPEREYLGANDFKDPVISPMYADLHGMPPTLFMTSGRDMLLSGTTTLQRAYLRAGVDARMVVFDGLPHAFWNDVKLPESREAYGYMAQFFKQQMSR